MNSIFKHQFQQAKTGFGKLHFTFKTVFDQFGQASAMVKMGMGRHNCIYIGWTKWKSASFCFPASLDP
jgi:hypothetical protein